MEPGGLIELVKFVLTGVFSPRAMAILLLTCAALLFGGPLNDWLGTRPVLERYGPAIGVSFAVAALALGVDFFTGPVANLHKDVMRWRRARKRLGELSEKEKAALRRYIDRSSRTQDFHANEPWIQDLVDAGILEKRDGDYALSLWPFVMSERVWAYLHENPSLLAPQLRMSQDEPKV